MKAPVAALKAARESRPGGRINLQESQSTTAATRQTRLLHASKNLQQVRGLGVLHGRLGSTSTSLGRYRIWQKQRPRGRLHRTLSRNSRTRSPFRTATETLISMWNWPHLGSSVLRTLAGYSSPSSLTLRH